MEWSLQTKLTQSHRKSKLETLSGCPHPLSRGHAQLLAQDRAQVAFEDLHNPSGQSMPVLCHLHSKKCFLMFR